MVDGGDGTLLEVMLVDTGGAGDAPWFLVSVLFVLNDDDFLRMAYLTDLIPISVRVCIDGP